MMRPFDQRVVPQPSGCWEWTGAIRKDGYGQCGRRGAHRAAYEHAYGPIPKGMFVCHSCDNPPCCNPAHLWIGSSHDNLVDCALKGRARGQQQTHCANGHEYTPENTYWKPGKVAQRDCRQCVKDRARNYSRRKNIAAGKEVRPHRWKYP